MPNEKKPKTECLEYLRHAEYYDMQSTFDELYARSQAGEIFDGLMDVILSRENILLAYRNIKSNTGSFTPGTDKLKISDIGKLTADEVTARSEEHTSELQSRFDLVCRLLLEKKKQNRNTQENELIT